MKGKRYKKLPYIPYPKNDKELKQHVIECHILPKAKKFLRGWLGTSSWENDHNQAHTCREKGIWRKLNHRHYK